jgi:predicted RNA-binding Zn-ribbon protein involved in translation (DUF1610 family)
MTLPLTGQRVTNPNAPIVRCPYCVDGMHFRAMRQTPLERYVCDNCGHMVIPGDSQFACICQKCRQLKPARVPS